MAYSRQQAPGELARLERFCNSARFLYAEDAFATPEAATTWLREQEFVPADFRVSESGLDRLVELRETIRAHLAGTEVERTVTTLNRQADELLTAPGWSSTGEPTLRGRSTKPDDELRAVLLKTLFTADLRGELGRLKPCAAPECLWIFYDRSPRANSIWCSMQICGARHKMRTYRTREQTR